MTNKLQHGDDFPFANKMTDDDVERCSVCDRKLGKNPLFIEVVDGGSIHDPSMGVADTSDSGYMGFWAVGSECAKQFNATITGRTK